ncbi:ABC transporter permease [Paenibacillus sp. MMS18-CY102]|uniref:ABC transporter permease n=1 Tax=Paenibacillus sp. MMS18-CY102 TaxID=2682849 RepID=UPI001366597D|nr:ABC transporter permease subunit [Paenibacillus sp. MMS18-CY102]MWC26890.1 ABC transporter permease subunit [Paenibacillus sp. MMS18-CY102]
MTLGRRFIKQWDFQLMIWPAMLFILVFSYGPMWGVLLAFKEYNIFAPFSESPWVGTLQFRMFFESPEFWDIMRNTFCIALLKLAIGFPAPIILALLLNEVGGWFKRLVQTVTYIPHFMSWVVISGMAFSMLSVDQGTVNDVLLFLHIIKEPINWLSTPDYFWGILVSLNVWKEIGFGSIVYLAAIVGIDPALYEAASIDGASRFKQIFLITIPSIMPIMIIFLILGIGNTLNAGYEDILVLTKNMNNGIVMPVANVIDTYVYQMGVLNQRYSYATAAGVFKSVLSVTLLLIANGFARRFGKTSLW